MKKCHRCATHIHLYSLGSTLNQPRQGPNALHVDELGGEGGVCRQLGELFQSLQTSVDAVGLDPLQELTSSAGLSAAKIKEIYINWIIKDIYKAQDRKSVV